MTQPSAASARRAAAERDALRDVIAILAHDLSNPLQSITVLCELGLDELADGADSDSMHLQQCLQAADRMRSLIHSIAAVVRQGGGPSPLGRVVARVTTLFDRRLDRHSIETRIMLGTLDAVRGPATLEFAIINLLLGYITAAGESGCRRHELTFTCGQLDGPVERCVLEMRMQAWPKETAPFEVACSPAHVQRAIDSLGDSPGELDVRGHTIALVFPGEI